MSEPRYFSYRHIGEGGKTDHELRVEMIESMKKSGATFFDILTVSAEHPRELYPEGIYVIGWDVEPENLPEFNYPMTQNRSQR